MRDCAFPVTMKTGWTSRFTHLECSACGKKLEPIPINTCSCGKPLLPRYDLDGLAPSDLLKRRDLWRFGPLLPVTRKENVVTLGEGGTPLVRARKLKDLLGVRELLVKDEGVNPTGTFKARGMAVAVSKAKELGVTKLAVATTGSAGSGLAAYAKQANVRAFIAFAKGTLPIHVKMSRALGAEVKVCDGYMNIAIGEVQRLCNEEGYFNVATMREPYRLEGKKTITYEVAEELGDLPDAMVFPVGGGTGIVAGWKAWRELKELGWCGNDPRLYFVQAKGCAPIFKAWQAGQGNCLPWPHIRTRAPGLAIPMPFADVLILRSARETGGGGVAVSDAEMAECVSQLEKSEGISSCLEGAATLAGARQLVNEGHIGKDDAVVLVNTGSKVTAV